MFAGSGFRFPHHNELFPFSSEGLLCLNRELLSRFMEDLWTDSMEQSISGR